MIRIMECHHIHHCMDTMSNITISSKYIRLQILLRTHLNSMLDWMIPNTSHHHTIKHLVMAADRRNMTSCTNIGSINKCQEAIHLPFQTITTREVVQSGATCHHHSHLTIPTIHIRIIPICRLRIMDNITNHRILTPSTWTNKSSTIITFYKTTTQATA